MKIDINNTKIKSFNYIIYGEVFRQLDNNFPDYWIKIKDIKIADDSLNSIAGDKINCIRLKDGEIGYYNDKDEVELISCVLKEIKELK